MLVIKGLNNFETVEVSQHFLLNLGKPLKTFVVLSFFTYFCLIWSLQTAESLLVAYKSGLQWGLNNFD